MSEKNVSDPVEAEARRMAHHDKVRTMFGDLVLAVLGLPRYQYQSVGDLQTCLLEPLLRNRVLIARPEGTASQMIGFAVWATVSEDVDIALRTQIDAGIFPPNMRPADWTSGDIAWVLDVVAPDAKAAQAIVAGLQKERGGTDIKLHPAVIGLLDMPPPDQEETAS